MIWRIYKYTNIITGQSYIGQTTDNVNRRARKDGKGYHKVTPFREAIDEYGWSNFEQSILRLCTTQEEADEYERHFIEKYNSVYPNGYNLQSGGKTGTQYHQITKQKKSDSMRNYCRTPEAKQKKSDYMREVWDRPEYRQKISLAMKGNTHTKGRKWFNDGTKSVMAYECPEGYVPGRLKS